MPQHSRVVDPDTQVELDVPEWTTPELAIERASRERAGLLMRLHLFPEWGVTWPVWEVGGDEVGRGRLELSNELTRDLLLWAAFREERLSIESGWSSDSDRDWWMQYGHDLEERLQREAWDSAGVQRIF